MKTILPTSFPGKEVIGVHYTPYVLSAPLWGGPAEAL